MYRICLLIFISLFSCVKADEIESSIEDAFASSLTNTESLVSTLVDSQISAITGEWIESQTDFILPGPEHIEFKRVYSSKSDRWRFNRPENLKLTISSKSEASVDQSYDGSFSHPSGALTLHKRKLSINEAGHPFYLKLNHKRGLTNCGSGEISARTNLNNTHVKVYPKEGVCKAQLGNGDFIYLNAEEKLKKGGNHFHASLENKASGNFIKYEKRSFSAFNSTGIAMFGQISWFYPSDRELFVACSDGKQATYQFDNSIRSTSNLNPSGYRIRKATFNYKPEEIYQYGQFKITLEEGYRDETGRHPPRYKHFALLTRKSYPNNRFIEIDYYQEGRNILPNAVVDIEKGDYRLLHVKTKKAPVGIDATPVVTQQFFYKQHGNNYITTVYDALNRQTVYSSNEDNLPLKIQKYMRLNNQYHLYSSEKYVWKKNDENFNGNLQGKYIQDANKIIHQARFFQYDKKGNILTDCFYGSLTGHPFVPIEIDSVHHWPKGNGVEGYKKTFTYSDDNLNLLLIESEDNGKSIVYEYLKGTNLVISKYLMHQGIVYLRQFYEYDQNTSLTKIIKDDGSQLSPYDLTGVTERHITYLFPHQISPFVGLPARINEMYFDLTTGQEKLLKSVVCHYSLDRKLIQQDHYDSQGALRYSLTWDWDAHGNLIKETNALGQIIIRKYDENNNLIWQQGPSFDYVITHEYDYANRCIATREDHAYGLYVTHYRYDLVGNRIATIDRFGQETQFVYDDLNRLVQTIYPYVLDENGYPIQPTEGIVYDIHNNPVTTIDRKGQTTHTRLIMREANPL